MQDHFTTVRPIESRDLHQNAQQRTLSANQFLSIVKYSLIFFELTKTVLIVY